MFRYGLLIIGSIFVLIPFLVVYYFKPDHILYNGEPVSPQLWVVQDFIWIGSLFIAISLFFQYKLYFARIGNQKIQLQNRNQIIESTWLEVESVKLIPIVFPPLYVITIKNREGFFLFNSGRSGISLMGFTFDWSDMGSLIKKKKREFGI